MINLEDRLEQAFWELDAQKYDRMAFKGLVRKILSDYGLRQEVIIDKDGMAGVLNLWRGKDEENKTLVNILIANSETWLTFSEKAFDEKSSLRKRVLHLLNKVNRVTCSYRHQKRVVPEDMNALVEAQIELESSLGSVPAGEW